MKKMVLVLLLVSLVMGCAGVHAEEVLRDGAVYQFSCGSSQLSLAVSYFGMNSASSAQLEAYDGSLNQAWRAHAQEDGTWKLECLVTQRYLTLQPVTGKVYPTTDQNLPEQKWYIERDKNGLNIISASSGLYLQPKNGKLAKSAAIYHSETNKQPWHEKMVDDGSTVFPHMLRVKGNIDMISCPEIRKVDGVYYLVGDNRDGCGIRTSTDMITWTALENAYTYDDVQPWMQKDVPNPSLWCPGLYKIGDTWYIYYALTTLYSQRSTIAIYSNKTLDPNDPAYEWVDAGPVISSYKNDPYNCIDPCVVMDDNGDPWLLFGSAWTGLKIVRLNAENGKLLEPENPKIFWLASRVNGDRAIEGGYMIKYQDHYYLFAAVGIMTAGSYSNGVGRSENITGPFYARDGVAMLDGGYKGGATLLTEEKSDMVMPGHCSVFQDDDGQWYFIMEYFPAGIDARLGISTLVWDEEGWPWTALTPNIVTRLGNGGK
ncbi:MAG: hypothetical protein E7324_00900 [Clostridiales bacterium]|nr:hypothetical protein [Clostridiales bacterium]